ncbi:hypothetical protein ABWH93_18105 [Seohaeicola saemankumensis]|jgi:hypothetical protein|uniref:hypothetical protein n=1 Tax=Seohaeicola TaxID=481178 RepID=UPI0035CFD92D|nr:hypothetical protein [Paracoccaceae bacterium]
MERKNPGKTSPAKGGTREERLKAALKANMARRKAQARARAAQQPAAGDDAPGQDQQNE